MFKIASKYPYITIAIVSVFALLPLTMYLDVTIMEARNFITAREMFNDGNWFLTTMNGIARYQKPPLPTWLTAVSGLLFGKTCTFALRIPLILMVLLLGIYIFKLSELFVNNRKLNLFTSLASVTSLYILVITIEGSWDIFTHGFMLMGIYYLIRSSKTDSNKIINAVLSGVFMGFSFLSKGPVSLYALFLPFIISYFITYGFKAISIKRSHVIVLILLAVVVGTFWFIAVRLLDPHTFATITKKETSNWSSYNVKPFYYYWDFFVQNGIWAIPGLFSLIYFFTNKRFKENKEYKLAFFWTILSVILLSIIPEKKTRYVVPALIPLAFTIGFYLNYLAENFTQLKQKWERLPINIHFILISVISIVAPVLAEIYFIKEFNLPLYNISFIILLCLLMAIGIYTLINLRKKHVSNAVVGSIFQFIVLANLLLPLTKKIESPDYQPIDHLKGLALEKKLKVYGYGYIAPEIIWQYGEKIKNIDSDDESIDIPLENTFWLLAQNLPEKEFIQNSKITLIDTFNLNNSVGKFSSSRKRLKCNLYEVSLNTQKQ
ncbi:ArnT family glycosyltransferase [Plebeiibacterium sediminum]|uniref:Glycosyltransferase n=1 Tax=Plebeiibacterium sediminum TaxID=2992112 RepID=A0AAE3SEN4_9BACT|nr:glycosyltransferase [Plebeiobacterium sediminum]MCW3786570.1 glycosyltransferase [Plebeiobacterium sediminum]